MHEVPRPPDFTGAAASKFYQVPRLSCATAYLARPAETSRATAFLVHHFGVGASLLNELERSAPPDSDVEKFTDVFFDTPDRQLALRGMWLRRRSCESRRPVKYEWSLKIASVLHEPQLEELLSVDETKNIAEIESYLRTSGLPPLPESKLTMTPLVVIDFARFIVSRNDRTDKHTAWVDCARIGPYYYVLGGCSFLDSGGEEAILTLTSQDGSSTKLDNHPAYLAPVRTKVIEAIRYAHPKLYERLIEKHVIPPEESLYYQAHAYEHPPDRFAPAFVHDPDEKDDE